MGHKKSDKIKFLAAIDPIIDDLNNVSESEKSIVRSQVTSALKNSQRTPNVPQDTIKAISELIND